MTAGNSSGINDGAAALLLASEAGSQARCGNPRAAGAHRRHRPSPASSRATWASGPIPATRQGAGPRGPRARPKLDLVELNEAFAAQVDPLHRPSSAWTRRASTSTAAPSRSGTRSAARARGCMTTLVHELGAARRAPRPGDDVHRRRPGDLHHHRAGIGHESRRQTTAHERRRRGGDDADQVCWEWPRTSSRTRLARWR